jgi:hypothetical protein
LVQFKKEFCKVQSFKEDEKNCVSSESPLPTCSSTRMGDYVTKVFVKVIQTQSG